MANEGGGENLFVNMFKTFPVVTTMGLVICIYVVWRSTGGIERGEERRATGNDSIFLEVTGVSPSYSNQKIFSAPESEIVE